MKILVTAAGTAGHINPALAITNKIVEEEKKKGNKTEVLFIGTSYGLENDLVPRAGYELKQVDAYGFYKKLTFDNIKKIIKTFMGIFKAKKIIKEFNPDVVIGTGGYICVPVIYAATMLKIPTILHESNAYAGLAIRLFDKKATKILLGLKAAEKCFKYKSNLKYVGNPTTVMPMNLGPEEKIKILKELGLTNKKTILVFGGSQGAQKINDAIFELVKNNLKNAEKQNLNTDYQIIWATGKQQYQNYKEMFEAENIDIENIPSVKVFDYIYNMKQMLEISDLAITRAGAMTITELSIMGLPSIFIPLESMRANKQEENAKVFVNAKAGEMILNKALTEKVLRKKLDEILLNRDLKKMSENAKNLAPQNVLDNIYQEILEVVNKK